MPVKQYPLRVSEAIDMVEEYVNEATEFLEQAKIVANAARNIAGLPQYLDQHLVDLIINIERIDQIVISISAIRKDLSDGVVEEEKKSESHGRHLARLR
jgi:hypothetical protein